MSPKNRMIKFVLVHDLMVTCYIIHCIDITLH